MRAAVRHEPGSACTRSVYVQSEPLIHGVDLRNTVGVLEEVMTFSSSSCLNLSCWLIFCDWTYHHRDEGNLGVFRIFFFFKKKPKFWFADDAATTVFFIMSPISCLALSFPRRLNKLFESGVFLRLQLSSVFEVVFILPQ